MSNENTPPTGSLLKGPTEPAPTQPTPPPPPAPQPKQDPPISKGRIVIYHAHVGTRVEEHTALVVCAHSATCCNLVVWNDSGDSYTVKSVVKGNKGEPNSWRYPERVS